ncbi:MAG: hypothetical protein PF569_01500 [Candidatus Woesearchaeota archaeon]|jgi:hypothetical protein|nr:hypothetical protein [Candidatus Woesearchaeota archaeon]
MEIKTKEISGIASAVKDMRNPMGSWDKSDSVMFRDQATNNLVLDTIGEKDEELLNKLCRAKHSSGHDCVLKSIIVHMDITATHDFFLQLYRYHFRDTTSSTSKMYSITKGDITDKCSTYVAYQSIYLVNHLIKIYNSEDPYPNSWDSAIVEGLLDPDHLGRDIPQTKSELFECIIHNTPIGYELTVGEVTNYLQLKTMYNQRKNHKMSSWSIDFVEWVKSLPMSYLITGETNDD